VAVVLEGVQSVPGGSAQLIRVEDVQNHWETLDRSAAIVFGSLTYMGRIAMNNPKMVFVGTHRLSLELSSTVEMDGPGFDAVCSFGTLEQLRALDAPDFSHALAVCVTDCAEVEEIHVVEKEEVVEEYDSPSWYYFPARVLPEAARCFFFASPSPESRAGSTLFGRTLSRRAATTVFTPSPVPSPPGCLFKPSHT
jgi:hypothetical protein